MRQLYIDGVPRAVGYLSLLRLDADCRAHPRLLLRAYAFLRQLHETDGVTPFHLSSIMADNMPAQRLLERQLPGMPRYQFIGEVDTLAVQVRPNAPLRLLRVERLAGVRITPARAEDLERLVALLNGVNASRDFAPAWIVNDLLSREREVCSAGDGSSIACRCCHIFLISTRASPRRTLRTWLRSRVKTASRPR